MRVLLVLLLASASWAQTGIMRVQRRAVGGGGGSSPTYVQSRPDECIGLSSCTVAFDTALTNGTVNLTSGNTMAVCGGNNNAGASAITISSSPPLTPTYTDASYFAGTVRNARCALFPITASGAYTFTVAVAVGTPTIGVIGLELAGANAAPLDQHTTANDVAAGNTTASLTTTGNTLLIGYSFDGDATGPLAAGYTRAENLGRGAMFYKAAAAGSQSITVSGNNSEMVVIFFSVKP